MKKEILKDALKIEELEDRFEMTVGALDGNRCCIGCGGEGDPTGDDPNDPNNPDNTGGNTGGGGGGGGGEDRPPIML